MPWPKLVVLCRHAESLGNTKTVDERAELEMATNEYPLTPLGEMQCQITGEYLRSVYGNFDVRYTSYYRRARQTMNILYPGQTAYEDARLAESQRGIWATMKRADIDATFPHELIRKQKEGLYHYRPFGGENWPDVELRVHSFLGTLRRDCSGKSVLIVCHGHWLILFQRLIEHFSPEEAIRRYEKAVVKNASLTIYEERKIKGKSRLILKNGIVVPWEGKI